MNQEEIKKRTDEKVGIIQAMMTQLQLTATAEEVVTSNGFIKRVIYYLDNEKYPEEEVKQEPFPTEDLPQADV